MTDETYREDEFKDIPYDEINYREEGRVGNILKAGTSEIIGKTKISVDSDEHEGVKVILKKDEFDNIKEIKFVCSCGQTKSVTLDYEE